MARDRRRTINRDSRGRRTGWVTRREEEEIQKLYLRENLTIPEIGKRVGRDRRTVKTHLNGSTLQLQLNLAPNPAVSHH